jgi:hypothetical protein
MKPGADDVPKTGMSPPAWPLSRFGQIALFQFYAFFWDQKSQGVHLEPEHGVFYFSVHISFLIWGCLSRGVRGWDGFLQCAMIIP